MITLAIYGYLVATGQTEMNAVILVMTVIYDIVIASETGSE